MRHVVLSFRLPRFSRNGAGRQDLGLPEGDAVDEVDAASSFGARTPRYRKELKHPRAPIAAHNLVVDPCDHGMALHRG